MAKKLLVHRILPPPFALLLGIFLIYYAERHLPFGQFMLPGQRSLALVLFFISLLLMLRAAWRMKRAHTTLNPLIPERSQRLVTEGIFQRSRNPIYLADAIILAGMVFWFGQWVGILVVAAFVIYINQVQIPTEERILATLFGEQYAEYCRRVPRWWSR